MKRKTIILFILIGVSLFGFSQTEDWANFSRYAAANASIEKSPRIVFMGNSLTDGWGSTHPEFFESNNFACRGISGQVTAQMLVRFRADVVDLHPQKVVILAGTNDIAQNPYHVAFDRIIGNIRSMCDIALANGIEPVLCTVLPCNLFYWNPGFNPAEKIREYNDLIRALAVEKNLMLVDFFPLLRDENDGMPLRYSADGVHPNSEGYDIMEDLLRRLGLLEVGEN